MAIPVNPVNLQGLANFAGQGMPNLNLKSTAVDVGAVNKGLSEGILESEKLKQQYAQISNALAVAQLQQQEAMKRQILQAQTQMAINQNNTATTMRGQDMTSQLGYDKLGQNAQIEAAKLQNEDRKFDLDTWYKSKQVSQKDQEIHQKEVMDDFQKKMKMKDVELEEINRAMGGFLEFSRTNPGDISHAKDIVADLMQQKGYWSGEEAKKWRESDDKTAQLTAQAQVKISATAGKAQQMGLTIDKDGNITYGPPGNPVKNASEQSVIDNTKQINTLDAIQSKIEDRLNNPKYQDVFTLKGASDSWLSRAAEKSVGLPVAEKAAEGVASWWTGKTKEERADALTARAEVMSDIDQVFNQYRKIITGAGASAGELDQLKAAYLNKEMSVSEYYGKMQSIKDSILRSIGVDKQVVTKGVPLSDAPKTIRIKRNGVVGTINSDEFDPKTDEKL